MQVIIQRILRNCQARLLLIFAQISKFHSQSLNSEKRSRADAMITAHPPTINHPPPPTNFFRLVEGWFSLSFSSQTKQKIFSIPHFQFSKFQKLLTTGDPVKTPSLRSRLWSSSHSFWLQMQESNLGKFWIHLPNITNIKLFLFF